MDTIRLYLLINHALYYDDDRKIAFALSYMKKGSTATWAEVRLQQGLSTLSFRTFTQFQTDFEIMFVNTNTTCEAMNWLSTTHIDSGEQLQAYINTFKLNVVHTKYDKLKDAATLISYFSAGLLTWIMHRVQAMDTIPATLAAWYKKAAHFCLQREIARKIALVTVLFPHRSVLLFFHTRCLLTWRGRRIYTNTSYPFICTISSFCFFDLSHGLS